MKLGGWLHKRSVLKKRYATLTHVLTYGITQMDTKLSCLLKYSFFLQSQL